ncbi:MAG TPA: extracellular solute-binding protein [Streptosporangiaceae bacterium]|jgi:multiple sugar transport system substrate-binding protein|nr:extracellular solute-binding protein [Streptosporangiaceae bacterium]
MKRSHKRFSAAFIAALAVLAAGCSSASSSGGGSGPVTLHAWLWDPTQLSSYQACANAFHAKTGVTVDISQSGWSDYWTNLTTQLAAGKGPDIITDHVGYYPQLVSAGQLVNLAPYFNKDGYNPATTGITTNGLWTRGSAIYGISQDRDAVALLYNTKDTSATSVTGLTWNPTDGGTFGALIRHLTVDKNGTRGDQPGFNKNDVKTYGFAMESGDGIAGQSSWATFALDMGWYWTTPQAPFATTYDMASPQLTQVFGWLQKQYDAGYIAPEARIASLGITPVMDQNVAATTFQGAWTISTYAPSADKNQAYAWAQLPVGPNGKSMTISNSLAQSVLTISQHPAQAAKWVEFVGSAACQNLVAAKAVVFPSIPSEATKVLTVDQAKGINVTPFTSELANPSDLVFWPITSDGTQINNLAATAIDDTLTRGQGNPSTVLSNLNNSINALFK